MRNNRAWLFIQKWVSDHAFWGGKMAELYFGAKMIAWLVWLLVVVAVVTVAIIKNKRR